jgi:hypothetical protein
LSAEEKLVVGKCRIIAANTIDDMSAEFQPDLISGWNAVWFTFQACMVPLVSLFSDTSIPEEADKWKTSIETALRFFERNIPWSIAAKRSLDAVSKLYQAYKVQSSSLPKRSEQPPGPVPFYQQHQLVNNIQDMGGFCYTAAPEGTPYVMSSSAVDGWNADPATMGNLSGFWDDMMWDKKMPDMLETPFSIATDYDFQATTQGSGAPVWMNGN